MGIKLDPNRLKRQKDKNEEADESQVNQLAVSAGAVDKVIDLAFNPSREKLREVTIIDRIQGRLFPLLDMINCGRSYVLEVALYRQDKDAYFKAFKRKRPIPPNLLDEYIYRTAQWQKSVAGKNLERATDIALAETEVRSGEDDPYAIRDPYEDK